MASTSSVYLPEPCQVCGENASGWHCSSITCEACKKFFLRSVNGEYSKYKCMRDRKCPITRTTRTQCQFCRYSKCIAIGMKITEENSNPKIEELFKEIPCAVCQSASSGIHFGTTTCEGCKGFFRRMIKERSPENYKCPEQNNCEVNALTRNICRACRFRKCLMVGMSIEGSRIGRQSNLFKHRVKEMQRQGLVQSQLFNIVNSNMKKTKVLTQTVVLRLEDKLEPQVFQQIIAIENAYINHLKDLPVCSNETNDLWTVCLSQLNGYSNHVRDFLDRIPNFHSINFEEKTSLIHSTTHSVILMCFCIQSSCSETLNNTWNYLNHLSDSSYFQKRFPFFFELNRLTFSFENELKILKLDHREIALLLSLLIVSIENSKFEQIQEEIFSALYDYMAAKRGIDTKDYFQLTIRIPFLHRLNKLIATYINNL